MPYFHREELTKQKFWALDLRQGENNSSFVMQLCVLKNWTGFEHNVNASLEIAFWNVNLKKLLFLTSLIVWEISKRFLFSEKNSANIIHRIHVFFKIPSHYILHIANWILTALMAVLGVWTFVSVPEISVWIYMLPLWNAEFSWYVTFLKISATRDK